MAQTARQKRLNVHRVGASHRAGRLHAALRPKRRYRHAAITCGHAYGHARVVTAAPTARVFKTQLLWMRSRASGAPCTRRRAYTTAHIRSGQGPAHARPGSWISTPCQQFRPQQCVRRGRQVRQCAATVAAGQHGPRVAEACAAAAAHAAQRQTWCGRAAPRRAARRARRPPCQGPAGWNAVAVWPGQPPTVACLRADTATQHGALESS